MDRLMAKLSGDRTLEDHISSCGVCQKGIMSGDPDALCPEGQKIWRGMIEGMGGEVTDPSYGKTAAKYTGNWEKDFENTALMPDLVAESVAEDLAYGIGKPELAKEYTKELMDRFSRIYKNDPKWAKKVISDSDSSRDYLAGFLTHWSASIANRRGDMTHEQAMNYQYDKGIFSGHAPSGDWKVKPKTQEAPKTDAAPESAPAETEKKLSPEEVSDIETKVREILKKRKQENPNWLQDKVKDLDNEQEIAPMTEETPKRESPKQTPVKPEKGTPQKPSRKDKDGWESGPRGGKRRKRDDGTWEYQKHSEFDARIIVAYKDPVTGQEYDCQLLDDGTMDTVVSCNGKEYRFGEVEREEDGSLSEEMLNSLFEEAIEMYEEGIAAEGSVKTADDYESKMKEQGKHFKIVLPEGMGEPLYTDSFNAAVEMAKEYGKGTRVVDLDLDGMEVLGPDTEGLHASVKAASLQVGDRIKVVKIIPTSGTKDVDSSGIIGTEGVVSGIYTGEKEGVNENAYWVKRDKMDTSMGMDEWFFESELEKAGDMKTAVRGEGQFGYPSGSDLEAANYLIFNVFEKEGVPDTDEALEAKLKEVADKFGITIDDLKDAWNRVGNSLTASEKTAMQMPSKSTGEGKLIVWDTDGVQHDFDISKGMQEYTKGRELYEREMAKFNGTEYQAPEAITETTAYVRTAAEPLTTEEDARLRELQEHNPSTGFMVAFDTPEGSEELKRLRDKNNEYIREREENSRQAASTEEDWDAVLSDPVFQIGDKVTPSGNNLADPDNGKTGTVVNVMGSSPENMTYYVDFGGEGISIYDYDGLKKAASKTSGEGRRKRNGTGPFQDGTGPGKPGGCPVREEDLEKTAAGYFSMVIKGTREDAERALQSHGIQAEFMNETSHQEQVFKTVGNEDMTNVLNAWLIEGPQEPPFPAGSLLTWSDHVLKDVDVSQLYGKNAGRCVTPKLGEEVIGKSFDLKGNSITVKGVLIRHEYEDIFSVRTASGNEYPVLMQDLKPFVKRFAAIDDEIMDLNRRKEILEQEMKDATNDDQKESYVTRINEIETEIGKMQAKVATEDPNFFGHGLRCADIEDGNISTLTSPASEEVSESVDDSLELRPKGEPGEGSEFKAVISRREIRRRASDYSGKSFSAGGNDRGGITVKFWGLYDREEAFVHIPPEDIDEYQEFVERDRKKGQLDATKSIISFLEFKKYPLEKSASKRIAEGPVAPVMGGAPEGLEDVEGSQKEAELDDDIFENEEDKPKSFKTEDSDQSVMKSSSGGGKGYQSSGPFANPPSALPGAYAMKKTAENVFFIDPTRPEGSQYQMVDSESIIPCDKCGKPGYVNAVTVYSIDGVPVSQLKDRFGKRPAGGELGVATEEGEWGGAALCEDCQREFARTSARRKKYPQSFHDEVQRAIVGYQIPIMEITKIYRAAEEAFDNGQNVTEAVKAVCDQVAIKTARRRRSSEPYQFGMNAKWTNAPYQMPCASCGEPIYEGEKVYSTGGKYYHRECASEVPGAGGKPRQEWRVTSSCPSGIPKKVKDEVVEEYGKDDPKTYQTLRKIKDEMKEGSVRSARGAVPGADSPDTAEVISGGPGQGMPGYKASYKGKWADLYANSQYEAQQIAAKFFGAKNEWEVKVMIAVDRDGKEIVHVPDF